MARATNARGAGSDGGASSRKPHRGGAARATHPDETPARPESLGFSALTALLGLGSLLVPLFSSITSLCVSLSLFHLAVLMCISVLSKPSLILLSWVRAIATSMPIDEKENPMHGGYYYYR